MNIESYRIKVNGSRWIGNSNDIFFFSHFCISEVHILGWEGMLHGAVKRLVAIFQIYPV